jgi:hypothetical protein
VLIASISWCLDALSMWRIFLTCDLLTRLAISCDFDNYLDIQSNSSKMVKITRVSCMGSPYFRDCVSVLFTHKKKSCRAGCSPGGFLLYQEEQERNASLKAVQAPLSWPQVRQLRYCSMYDMCLVTAQLSRTYLSHAKGWALFVQGHTRWFTI